MNDVVSTFPLLHLPTKAILNTLRSMNHLEIFGISILSKKTKNLVRSLKLTTKPVTVFVTNAFETQLNFLNDSYLSFQLYQVLGNQPLQELETPENVSIGSKNASVTWTNGMSVKELLDHFQFIFHTSISILYFGLNCERFSLESIKKNVKDFQSICFLSENHDQNRRVLNFFRPTDLALVDVALDNGHVPRYISIQNFDDIIVLDVQINLDDLLITNSRLIYFECTELSAKILNQFLKLWMKGSNPRLEWAHLKLRPNGFQIDDVLKKLNHKVAPSDRLKHFTYSDKKGLKKVIGGWDIWRFDGTQATITSISSQVTQPPFYPIASPHSFTSSAIMDDVVSTLPLLHLPIDAMLNTLRSMSHLEIYGISTLSRKTANLVESLKVETSMPIGVVVDHSFRAFLFFPNNKLTFVLYQAGENEPIQELEMPGTIDISSVNETVTWTNKMSVKQLLDHLELIFHSSITSLVFFSEQFSVESIHRIIKKVRNLHIFNRDQEYSSRVLSLIQTEALFICESIPRKILIQNFDVISAPSFQITLDELLMTNARRIDMSCRLPAKVFNQFLKQWTKGCNFRLEWLQIRVPGNSQKADVLKGLKFKDAPQNSERIFKCSGNRKQEKVIGGWDIRRIDGTQATVTVRRIDDSVAISLFVWHDHCVGNSIDS